MEKNGNASTPFEFCGKGKEELMYVQFLIRGAASGVFRKMQDGHRRKMKLSCPGGSRSLPTNKFLSSYLSCSAAADHPPTLCEVSSSCTCLSRLKFERIIAIIKANESLRDHPSAMRRIPCNSGVEPSEIMRVWTLTCTFRLRAPRSAKILVYPADVGRSTLYERLIDYWPKGFRRGGGVI